MHIHSLSLSAVGLAHVWTLKINALVPCPFITVISNNNLDLLSIISFIRYVLFYDEAPLDNENCSSVILLSPYWSNIRLLQTFVVMGITVCYLLVDYIRFFIFFYFEALQVRVNGKSLLDSAFCIMNWLVWIFYFFLNKIDFFFFFADKKIIKFRVN